MRLIAIQRRAFAAVWPNELAAITDACLKLRRGGWQVVRLDTDGGELDPRDAYAAAVVYGEMSAVEHFGDSGAAVLSCSPRPWVVPVGGDVTQEAVDCARDWGADTLVVVGPEANAPVINNALLEGHIQAGAAVPKLSLENLAMLAGAFSDVRLGRKDHGGLPGGA